MRSGFPSLPMLRDAVVVAVIAVTTVQALRLWVADRYLVPTGSMQPLLYGDPEFGDIVLVDKLARAADRKRHDLVVVQEPGDARKQIVKRIAASGDDADGCWINILHGDLYIGASKQSVHLEQKDPLTAKSMRVTWARWPGGEAEKLLDLRSAAVGNGELQLPPLDVGADAARAIFRSRAERRRRGVDTPPGFVGTARPIDATYVDLAGVHSRIGDDAPVNDAGMELDLAAAVDGLLGCVDGRNEALTFSWRPATGQLQLWRNGDTVAEAQLPASAGAHRVAFGVLDNRAFFVVDDRRDAMFVFERRADWLPDADPLSGNRPHCHVQLAVLGKAPLRLRALTVFHDLYCWRNPVVGLPDQPGEWPRLVPPGHWFLLGDSPFDSRDSRQFGPVPMRSFLGAPCCVISPWSRHRWLCP